MHPFLPLTPHQASHLLVGCRSNRANSAPWIQLLTCSGSRRGSLSNLVMDQHICCMAQAVLHGVMDEEDVRSLYLWLERLAKNPHTENEAKSIVAGKHPPT